VGGVVTSLEWGRVLGGREGGGERVVLRHPPGCEGSVPGGAQSVLACAFNATLPGTRVTGGQRSSRPDDDGARRGWVQFRSDKRMVP
jgi:hypothetical protein